MLEELMKRYPALDVCKDSIRLGAELIIDTYKQGGKVLVCGNGGSAADSEHIVGELMKGFLLPRTVSDERIPEDYKAVTDANKELIKHCDEVWVFGEFITEVMSEELKFCKTMNIRTRRIREKEIRKLLGGKCL